MTKAKLFSGYYVGERPDRKFVDVDEELTQFLSTGVEYVDAKYETCYDEDGVAWNHVLLIYKDKIEN